MPKLTVKRKARANGEGTVFRQEVKRKDGSTYTRWVGKVKVGHDADGKRKRKNVYGRTQAEVLEKIAGIKQELATGTFVKTELTLRSYLERWHREKAREVKPRTVELYREQADRHIIPKLGGVKLSKLEPMHLQNLCGDLADTVGKRTAEMVRVQLHGALKQAVRWQLLPRNPAEAVTPIKVPKQPITIWTPSEAARFLDTARAHRLYAAFYLAMSTGLRRGELLGLRWTDIKGDRLKVMTSKTRKGHRTLKLSKDVVAGLTEHRERQEAEKARLETWRGDGLVFTSTTGTPIVPRNFERTWKDLQNETRSKWLRDTRALLEVATLTPERRDTLEEETKALEEGRTFPTLRLHDLRHLHASMLITKAKRSAVEVAERLGHTNPSFTMDVYGHLFAEHHEEEEVSILDFLPSTGGVN